jgi:hypothetical protein
MMNIMYVQVGDKLKIVRCISKVRQGIEDSRCSCPRACKNVCTETVLRTVKGYTPFRTAGVVAVSKK